MPKLDIEPTCRYDHGNLKKVNGEPGFPSAFAVSGMNLVNEGAPLTPAGTGLLLDVFECPVCGYTELFELRQK